MTKLRLALSLTIILVSVVARADDLARAQRALQDGQFQQALSLLNQHLEQFPEDASGLFNKGLALTMLQRRTEAISVYQNLSSQYPDLPEPANNLAVLYAREHRYLEARDTLEKILEQHSSYTTAHENLGDIYAALARASYTKAASLNDHNKSVQLKLDAMETVTALATSRAVAAKSRSASKRGVPAASSEKSKLPHLQAVVESKPADEVAETLRSIVESWRKAWQDQDADSYLGFYSTDFIPGHEMSRSDWMQQRRQRVSEPASIKLQLRKLTVNLKAEDYAQLEFDQHYTNEIFSDVVRKRLHFRQQNGRWLIERESVLKLISSNYN